MKSLRTKVILSAFVLLFALVATIGSTYAWFTVSQTTTVDAITVTVTTEQSLLIKVWDGETETPGDTLADYGWTADDFVNTVSQSLIALSSQYTNFADYQLKPVTAASGATGDATDYTALDMDALSTIDIGTTTDRALTLAQANRRLVDATPTAGYIELKFWLVTQTGTGITVKVSEFSATGSTVSQAMYLGAKSETDANERIYSIDSDWGFVFGPTDTGYSATALLNSVVVAQRSVLTGLESDTAGTGATSTLVTLSAEVPELITVRLWIEGWDAQATNSLMGETTDITFAFSIFTVV